MRVTCDMRANPIDIDRSSDSLDFGYMARLDFLSN
jgi:hypothetical protein